MTLRCTIEIEWTSPEGATVHRKCGRPARWAVRQAVRGGQLADSGLRCDDHIGGTLDFLLGEPSTSEIHLISTGPQL